MLWEDLYAFGTLNLRPNARGWYSAEGVVSYRLCRSVWHTYIASTAHIPRPACGIVAVGIFVDAINLTQQ